MKDEMKNKISMALKDPILQQGFEVICKNLVELEKENSASKQEWEGLKNTISDCEEFCNKYTDLVKENADLRAYNKKLLQSDIDKQNKIVLLSQKVNDLQKKNAELDCQKNRNKACYSCVNATERCFTNEIGCPCEKYKSYKDENAELKEYNKYLRRKRQGGIQKQYNKVAIIKQQDKQLTKAKEIIKNLLILKNDHYGNTKIEWRVKVTEQAEQFLKEE